MDNNLIKAIIDSELKSLGLEGVTGMQIVKIGPDHKVARIFLDSVSIVAKWYAQENPLEVAVYKMLQSLGVPTLPVIASTGRLLLLEDLDQSRHWRLATDDDLERRETGAAIARWYKTLHAKGQEFLGSGLSLHPGLEDWPSRLTVDSLGAAGERYGLDACRDWAECLAMLEPLKRLFYQCRQTFNYDDFAIENLALSRDGDGLEAVVFDYDRFCLGARFGDWRNVACSLCGDSLAGFADGYGQVDASEKIVDKPLSILFGIQQASMFDGKPSWVSPLIGEVLSGRLNESAVLALERCQLDGASNSMSRKSLI